MMMMMMKMKKETRYVTVEELDALARERLATHYALETARFSFASEDVRNEIVLSLHRSKSSSSFPRRRSSSPAQIDLCPRLLLLPPAVVARIKRSRPSRCPLF